MQFVFGVVSAAGGIISSSTHQFRVTVIQKKVQHYSNYYIEFVPPLDCAPAVFGTQLYPNISYNSVEKGGKTTDNVVVSEVTPNGFYMGTTDYWANGNTSTMPRNFSFVALCSTTTSEPDSEPYVIGGCVAPDGQNFIFSHSDVPLRVTKVDTGIYDVQFSELKALPAVIVTQHRCATGESKTGNTRDNAILTGISKSTIRVKTGDSNGDAADRPFNFIVFSNLNSSVDKAHHQFFYTGLLLSDQNDHADHHKRLVSLGNGIGEVIFNQPFPSVPVVLVQQRFKSAPCESPTFDPEEQRASEGQATSDGIGSGLDNAVVQKTNNISVVVEAGDANGWLAARFVYLLAFAYV
jgi:hypothetical protein